MEEDIKQIKSSLKELETERDDIQIRCIKAELELSIENILNELERLQKEFEAVDHECFRLEKKELKLEKEIEEWQKAYQEEKDEQFNMLINKKRGVNL